MTQDTKPMVINMGPQHPSTHGVLRLVLELDGETVVGCEPQIGYLHTGIEKTAEDLTYTQAITVIERMDYLSPLTNNLAYVLAVEKLLGIEVPERVNVLRVMFTELSRLASHLVWLGTAAMDMGAMSVFFYCFRERELILDLFEMAAGARLHPMYFRVGGVLHDIPDGFLDKLKSFLVEFPKWMNEYHSLLSDNILWVERLKGIAKISREDCLEYGLTGPVLRGTGLAHDLRKTNPYCGYESYDFDIPSYDGCDAYARYCVRIDEMRQGYRILQQTVDRLPEGPTHIDDWRIFPPAKQEIANNMEALIYHFKLFTEGFRVPKGEAYAGIEGPKGEIGAYVVSDGSARPMRFRCRPPSFYSLQALPKMVRQALIADTVAAIGSIDIVLGEVDR